MAGRKMLEQRKYEKRIRDLKIRNRLLEREVEKLRDVLGSKMMRDFFYFSDLIRFMGGDVPFLSEGQSDEDYLESVKQYAVICAKYRVYDLERTRDCLREILGGDSH